MLYHVLCVCMWDNSTLSKVVVLRLKIELLALKCTFQAYLSATPHTFLEQRCLVHIGGATVNTNLGLADSFIKSLLLFLLIESIFKRF